jgi:hypothetical protein
MRDGALHRSGASETGNAMTDTEIQIAIAECCGWIPHAWRIRLSNEEAMVMIQAKKKTQSG